MVELMQEVLDIPLASAVLEAAFPHMPRPARTAVGVTSLPGRSWAEIEISALLDDRR